MQQKLKQKHIESFLQDMEGFDQAEKQKWCLEQHMTTPDIAAQMMFEIYHREPNLENMISGDLGCGTGMLMAGMLYIGTMYVVGFEIDTKYVKRTQEQLMEKFEDESLFDLVNINVKNLNNKCKYKMLDIVVMNPPFDNCEGKIYSLHKSSTREFLKKTSESWGYDFEVIQTFKFPLPKRFSKYHKKGNYNSPNLQFNIDNAFTEVDFICLNPKKQIQKEQNETKE
ncbi:hypothetical protein PPERSA_09842 [Pseudocohnilembus persalinus]|uniref:Methyltransferase small domain-containing protein n=1 Tax=Pseudocohnilembus persalinus TaxID=266149 RepID=A0A0V0QU14_PSEPJ|nr:hypothetical protein PPERSA_09842 [Pseudocohnilembus persalinus]|eukprot:KRX05702.1 hypothetical protein PPERSA_09842 [Pseudocohnilembus persalinus]